MNFDPNKMLAELINIWVSRLFGAVLSRLKALYSNIGKLPRKLQERRIARSKLRSLRVVAASKNLTPDEMAQRLGWKDARAYKRGAVEIEIFAQEYPSLGLDMDFDEETQEWIKY